jgi:transcriptional regulator with XRE-family HTH domain
MMTLEDIKKKLEGKNYSEVARSAGLTRAYVSAIMAGKHLNPRYETIRKLSEALKDE